MTRTVQQLLDNAKGWSLANGLATLTSDDGLILGRVDTAQQDLFTKLAQENRYLWVAREAKASNSGASARSVDLAAFTMKVERVLLVQLPSGAEVYGVPLDDTGAELSPRYFPLGTTLVEVGSDWSAVSGAVTLTVTACTRPAALTINTDLTQLVSLDDRFCDYLELDLSVWLALRDFGREAVVPQVQALGALQEAAYQRIVTYADHLAGVLSQRFQMPTSPRGSKA